MRPDQAAAAIRRFADACQAHELVAAAFLGGSYAAGTATEDSDIDVYVVTNDADYVDFFGDREAFMRSWMDAPELETIRNFEGLGFDMLSFSCRDGVWGQVALGHASNMMSLHGGPHVVLVDKAGLLDGVTFLLL
jgi:predicted nucleotidyltransferase